jgi:hypothetical protein
LVRHHPWHCLAIQQNNRIGEPHDRRNHHTRTRTTEANPQAGARAHKPLRTRNVQSAGPGRKTVENSIREEVIQLTNQSSRKGSTLSSRTILPWITRTSKEASLSASTIWLIAPLAIARATALLLSILLTCSATQTKAQIDPRSISPVLLAAGFTPGQASWTGRYEKVTLYDHTQGISCQYHPQFGEMFWKTFRGYTCPQFVDVP